ncbi:phenazine antibiotic biosynthesis protein [Streptomyces sp. YU58]|uniref:phenazine antibiotic biosynthesis protein n=1 Tax=Streptomyces sp. SX92 TaxID=3158972 RepID=UPI0027BB0CB5|nr:phenazine antibiotic biosynthesis protein [Streptomyces coralus]WLW57548.1 phenazine antibiotic biosynthesis protein [Streptomyces coralus]
MSNHSHVDRVLDCPMDETPGARELLEAAMQWHFSPETGSPFWLERAKKLDFDPRADVHTFDDLKLFPNVVNELREVRAEELIPRGYGSFDDLYGVYESGGTTGAPKRVVCMNDWMERWLTFSQHKLDERGCPRNVNWLALMPDGPHIFGAALREGARRNGGILFTIDMDPRWVKKCIGEGRAEDAGRYAEHLVNQARHLLETQDVGVMITTPPLLERLAQDERLVELINRKVSLIQWGGAHMDADTRHLFRTEVFPGIQLQGAYGSTMILGGSLERVDTTGEDACVFDPLSPYISFSVIDPATGENVPYGERGQVVMNHISKGMLLPNNLERDTAVRMRPPEGQLGDSVAQVAPVASFDDEVVIEGVY